MNKISKKQQKVLDLFLNGRPLSSSEVHNTLLAEGEETSLVTVKRELSRLD